MKGIRNIVWCSLLLSTVGLGSYVWAAAAKRDANKDTTATPVEHTLSVDEMRVQGEQRFRANCGRCHASPQKFPPRVMKTVMRHMRVRATITDDDMRMVLFYMTQ